MAKDMISTDMIDEQLFTELTAEEGSIVEGGATFTLHSLKAHTAWRQDDLYLKFNGKKFWGTEKDVDKHDFFEINESFSFDKWNELQLWDDDRWFDDHLGTLKLDPKRKQDEASFSVSGWGYNYTINYSIS